VIKEPVAYSTIETDFLSKSMVRKYVISFFTTVILLPFSLSNKLRYGIFIKIGSSWCGFAWGVGLILAGINHPDVIRNAVPFIPSISFDPTLAIFIYSSNKVFQFLNYYYQTKVTYVTRDQTYFDEKSKVTWNRSWNSPAILASANQQHDTTLLKVVKPEVPLFLRSRKKARKHGNKNIKKDKSSSLDAYSNTIKNSLSNFKKLIEIDDIYQNEADDEMEDMEEEEDIEKSPINTDIKIMRDKVDEEEKNNMEYDPTEQFKMWAVFVLGSALMGHSIGWSGIPFGALLVNAGADVGTSLVEYRLPYMNGSFFFAICTLLSLRLSFSVGTLIWGLHHVSNPSQLNDILLTNDETLTNVKKLISLMPLTPLAPDTVVAMYLQRSQTKRVLIVDVRKEKNMTSTYVVNGNICTCCSNDQTNDCDCSSNSDVHENKKRIQEMKALNVLHIPFNLETR
jgi:hypothetical protein